MALDRESAESAEIYFLKDVEAVDVGAPGLAGGDRDGSGEGAGTDLRRDMRAIDSVATPFTA